MLYLWRRIAYRSLFPLFVIFWFLARPTLRGALCLVIKDGQLLMIRNSYGLRRWSLPGGFINAREDPRDAAIRELREETGLIAARATKITDFLIRNYFKHDHIHLYRIEEFSGELEIEKGEILEAKWFALDNLPTRLSKPMHYIAEHELI